MPTQRRDLIVVGASAGGVEALRSLVAGFPPDLDAAVAVVLHMPTGGTSALPQILRRFSELPTVTAENGMEIQAGVVHVARPRHHLLVVDGRFALSHGPTENGHIPAINALFRSAAVSLGPRVIGVQLSGMLDDGVAGLVAIKAQGGLAVVQDPSDALYSGMPQNALQNVSADHVVPVAEMGMLLAKLTSSDGIAHAPPAAPLLSLENEIARDRVGAMGYQASSVAMSSGFSCPDCNGVLNELEPRSGRFRCRVGHAWSTEALMHAQGDMLERALWTALRALDEKASMAERMRRDNSERGNERLARRYARIGEETRQAAELLRERLTTSPFQAGEEVEP